jgi:uncharacterized protein YggE
MEGSTGPGAGPSPTVTVRGMGVAAVRPDGVRVGLTVEDRREAADEALGEAANKAQALDVLFRELGIDEGEWVTVGLGLHEWTEWDESSRREVRRGYVASNRVEVRLPGSASLGRLLAEAAARTEASADGPRWQVDPDNSAYDEARRRAMADAWRRAETYAEGAGLVLGTVVQVVEVGAERPHEVAWVAGSARGATLSGATEMPVHGEGLEIVAGVHVTFLLISA